MDFRNKEIIRDNFQFLLDELRAEDVVSDLYSDGTIEMDDHQRILAEVTDKDRAIRLLRILLSRENSYLPFVTAVRKLRPDIAERLEGTEIDDERIQKMKENAMGFLREVIRQKFCKSDKSILASDVRETIECEYLRNGRIDEFEPSNIECCFKELFENFEKKKASKKRGSKSVKVWKYRRIEKRVCPDETDESDIESIEDNLPGATCHRSESAAGKDVLLLCNVSSSDIEQVLKPYFIEESIDESYLNIFEKEKIDGKVFIELSIIDLGQLYPSMLFGDKKRILKIKDSILEKEQEAGPHLLLSFVTESGKPLTELDIKSDTDMEFKEIFRTFDTTVKATDAYRQNAVLRTSNLYVYDLIEPIHNFQHKEGLDIPTWIASESVKFAASCLTERTNGTIHFGISENTNTDGVLEGRVIGIPANQSKIIEIFYRQIRDNFYKDQLGLVLHCIRPPQFVEVRIPRQQQTDESTMRSSKNIKLYIVEIDIVPNYELTKNETFYFREMCLEGFVPRLYKFVEGTPTVLKDEDFKHHLNVAQKIYENRRSKEMKKSSPERTDDLRERFLNFYTAGSDVLTNEIYPVFLLSPLDSAMNEDFVSENFEFLLDIEPLAIFDFHSSIEGKCLYNFIEADQERVVKVLTTDNFDRHSKENQKNPESFNNLFEDLKTSQLKPWVFCNGYEPLDKGALNKLEWKKQRMEGFKEAMRFIYQEIPQGRALVIFVILSKNHDIMLEIVEEVVLKFQNQWIVMAEDECVMNNWRTELLRRESVDKKTLNERCIIGLPWKHVNTIVKEVNSVPMATRCQLPTSTGSFCFLKEKVRNELCDIDILSRNECDQSEIIQDKEKLEKHRRSVEEKFYQGGRVTWWNLWFENDHVLKRTQHEKIVQCLKNMAEGKCIDDDSRVPVFNLFHQPGAGGTTTAHHVLWFFKDAYRCCVIKKITDQTSDQIERLRNFEDPENPKPPIILIDNEDEERVQNLHARLEYKARIACRRGNDPYKVFCLLFLCIRRANLPVSTDNQTVQLKHDLSPKELEWCNRKYQKLNELFEQEKGVDPKLLISFNILKENFDHDYIKRTVKEFVDGIEELKEKKLLQYLSLLNSFDIDFQSVQLSAFDILMESGKQKLVFSSGSVSSHRGMAKRHTFKGNWENKLSQSVAVLLNRNNRVNTGGGQALSIISKVFAKAILYYIVQKENSKIGDMMIEFLDSEILRSENFSTRQLKKIIQDVLKRREILENSKKDTFSPLVLEILKTEGPDKASRVLETGFHKTGDAMVAQQIARLYIHVCNWEKAEEFAVMAVQSRRDNSYLWDTHAQIYKKRLADKYKECLTGSSELNENDAMEIVKIAAKGIDLFTQEQRISERSNFARDNDAGYFGEIQVIVQLLDLLSLWPPAKDKKVLHGFLVNMLTPKEFNLFQDHIPFLRSLQERSESTMRTIEDKFAQLKSGRDVDIFKTNASVISRSEFVRLQENLDNYFGEFTHQVPEHLNEEEKASFRRRRIKRLGGRSSASVLDLRYKEGGKEKLLEMRHLLLENINSRCSQAYDYVTLITVTLVRSMMDKTPQVEFFRDLVKWSKSAYDKAIQFQNDQRPLLEPFMYFVMIHWPTESRKKYNLCSAEEISEAIKVWKKAFNKVHPKQKDDSNPFRKKETTYFFLGKGNGSNEIHYYLDIKRNQSHLEGEAIWRSKSVKEKLQQLKGTLLSEGWEIQNQVQSPNGNRSIISVVNSYPSPRSLWQKTVNFYLGFSWKEPKAFVIVDDTPSEDRDTESQRSTNQSKQYQKHFSPAVLTHEAFHAALSEIDSQLRKIEALKKLQKRLNREDEEVRKEPRLKEERNDLIEERIRFVNRN